MGAANQTHVSEFLLLGFSEKPEHQLPLFGLFLSMYLVTVGGNLLIMLTIASDSHLHTPMYFFLSNLSLVDFCLVTTLVPKMLVNLLTHSKAISYAGCLTQMYFFMVFACLDTLLLTVMAYDRFVAICHPLSYVTIMSVQLCGLLVLLSWTISLVNAVFHSLLVLRLLFCTEREIPHFYCDLTPILKLSCTDTFINNILVYLTTGLLGVLPFTGIFFSYTQICSSILRVPSTGGKYKAFSTCGSHLCVVLLFYGTFIGVYLSSSATVSSWKSSVASVMYTVVTPMLNPFIYSLRNKDIKDALRRLIGRLASLSE
ncbi:olfactory receptor 7C1-like [Trichosurus vulpecula]|uniref:olfactory receptor 7C1-like n=1 Tax=Trichosurus vulpecula TaxID=9337 RepID=UPI00186AC2FD|nr:olfactory receptor 7C1-like [Trichosurus vulpecula]